METPQILRDCLQKILDEGVEKNLAQKTAYLLAKDFKRLNWPLDKAVMTITDWAAKCDPPILGSQVRGLQRAVEKVYEKDDLPLSCSPDKFLKLNGYCFLKSDTDRGCEFNNTVQTIREFQRGQKMQETGWAEWEKYLQVRYKSQWLYLSAFYQALKIVEIERGIPQNGTVFVGFRELRARIMSRHRDFKPSLETLCLCSKIIESEGLVRAERVPHKRRGTFHPQANGYVRVIPIPAPPPYTHIMSDTQIMCSSDTATYMCSSPPTLIPRDGS